MRLGSTFSGIGGFDLAFERAGMTVAWQVEIDAKAGQVLKEHWPDVPNYRDITAVHGPVVGAVDVLAGGFPCQDLSVAGRRAGLAGERSGLFYEFARLVDELHPRWIVLENVPGLLSSRGGRDMGAVVGTLAELGYGWAYRVLDAQHFGVPQRRRRVFIVGHLGDAARAAQVLFEPESLRGDPPTRHQAGQDVTAGPLGSTTGGQRQDLDGMTYLPAVARSLNSGRDGYNDGSDQTYIPDVAWALQERDAKGSDSSTKPGHLIPVPFRKATKAHHADDWERWEEAEQADTLSSHGTTSAQAVTNELGVRRLTPLECERLQGFPDGWTDCGSDSARYRQLGNAVAVPVVEWIGRRLMAVEAAQEVAA